MASNQCGNCGGGGHYRANCPLPKSESLQYWHAAKAQFRRENPEAAQKLRERRDENRKWQDEGKTVAFSVLNEAIDRCLQTLLELSNVLDVLGRPKDWEEVNKKLDSFLPLIREIVHNGKGFLFYGRITDVVVDGDIFISRLDQLQNLRDHLVQHVKSFVNGKLGKLGHVNSRNNPEELLGYIYEHHPPKRQGTFDAGSTLRNQIRKALLHYHPDKQADYDAEWKTLCEAISRCLTNALGQL